MLTKEEAVQLKVLEAEMEKLDDVPCPYEDELQYDVGEWLTRFAASTEKLSVKQCLDKIKPILVKFRKDDLISVAVIERQNQIHSQIYKLRAKLDKCPTCGAVVRSKWANKKRRR